MKTTVKKIEVIAAFYGQTRTQIWIYRQDDRRETRSNVHYYFNVTYKSWKRIRRLMNEAFRKE